MEEVSAASVDPCEKMALTEPKGHSDRLCVPPVGLGRRMPLLQLPRLLPETCTFRCAISTRVTLALAQD